MIWNFEQFADRIALTDDAGASISYSELQSETDALAGKIGRRCLVFSLCSNTIDSVVGYVAFVNNRIVPALLNSQLDSGLLLSLIDTYKPSYIWLPDGDLSKYRNFEKVFSGRTYCLLKTGYPNEYTLHSDLALLLTTSGSTGSPKFVRQMYKNIEINTKQIVDYLQLDESEKPITTLPMNYTYGCSIINTHLLVGAEILLTDKTFFQREFWNFFKEKGATSFGGVPYTYEMLEKLRFFRMKLPSLRTMTQAGGKLDPELHKKFAEYAIENNKHFVVMYGACEATARMGYLPYDKALVKIGSMGIPVPGGKFAIIDTENNEIKDAGIAGELVYSGDNVTMGYAVCGDDLARGDERGGILHTGDVAKRDDDGYYYIVGRLKRFLKIYGNRVNLDEIEQLIKSQFDCLNCAVGGVDDLVYIFITDSVKADAVRKYISEKTGLNVAAFKIVTLDSIPKSDSGKTLYRELEKYYSK